MDCPKCGAMMLKQPAFYVCQYCAHFCHTEAAAPVSEAHSRQYAPFQGSEKQLIAAIKRDLEKRGYIVLRVGQLVAAGSGTDEGCPDLFVSKPGCNQWRALEAKVGNNQPSEAQEKLIYRGVSCVVRSVEEAREAVER